MPRKQSLNGRTGGGRQNGTTSPNGTQSSIAKGSLVLVAVWFPFQYTDKMISMIAPHVPHTKVLNLHEKKSVLSTLLCNVLPNTPETCLYSLEKDAEIKQEFRANTQGSFRDQSKGNMQTITAYDEIAMEAVKQGLLNTTLISRRQAGLQCRDFHRTVLNKTVNDLAMKCPSQADLHSLLNQSLVKEQDIVPEFYQTNQDSHWASFWKAVVQNKFCVTDAAAVLKNAKMEKFRTDRWAKGHLLQLFRTVLCNGGSVNHDGPSCCFNPLQEDRTCRHEKKTRHVGSFIHSLVLTHELRHLHRPHFDFARQPRQVFHELALLRYPFGISQGSSSPSSCSQTIVNPQTQVSPDSKKAYIGTCCDSSLCLFNGWKND